MEVREDDITIDPNDPEMVDKLDNHERVVEEFLADTDLGETDVEEFDRKVSEERQDYAARRVEKINTRLATACKKRKAQDQRWTHIAAMRKLFYVCVCMITLCVE